MILNLTFEEFSAVRSSHYHNVPILKEEMKFFYTDYYLKCHYKYEFGTTGPHSVRLYNALDAAEKSKLLREAIDL